MIQEFYMNEEKFEELIHDVCIPYIFEDSLLKETGKKKLWNEIYYILSGKSTNDKWARLIESKIFRNAVGTWIKVEGQQIYVEV